MYMRLPHDDKGRGEVSSEHQYLRLGVMLDFQSEGLPSWPLCPADLCGHVSNKIQQTSLSCGGGALPAECPEWPFSFACALRDFSRKLVSVCKRDDAPETVAK
jgi:hypothetical protein